MSKLNCTSLSKLMDHFAALDNMEQKALVETLTDRALDIQTVSVNDLLNALERTGEPPVCRKNAETLTRSKFLTAVQSFDCAAHQFVFLCDWLGIDAETTFAQFCEAVVE